MMNIPLLFWAGKETGDRFFTDVAIAHADTTLHNFIRPDGSVCHAYRFDSVTGEPAEEFNDCGYSVGSHWARGTAWAVYGFSVAWRYTGLTRYRDAAVKLAECYLTQCGENGVPVWDFRLPTDQPARHCGRMAEWPHWDVTDPANCTRNVDTSAAAIMACGMLEFLAKEEHAGMRSYVDAVTRTLTVQYMNTDEGCAGLLHSQNGNASYTSFGDYYLMELLARQLGSDILPW